MEPTFTLSAYRIMREHAGTSYRPSIETAEQGAVRGALELARAEMALSREPRAWIVWEPEPEPDISWMDEDARAELERGETVMEAASLWSYSADGDSPELLAQLANVHNLAGEAGDGYRRAVAAGLALEAGICDPRDRDISGALDVDAAHAHLRAGGVVVATMGKRPADPVLRLSRFEGMILSDSIRGWSAGVSEPVCAVESDFVRELLGRAIRLEAAH